MSSGVDPRVVKDQDGETRIIPLTPEIETNHVVRRTDVFLDSFLRIRDTITNMDEILREEHSIDPSITKAATELEIFRNDIKLAVDRILSAMQKRDKLELEVAEISQKVATSALRIEQSLNLPQRDRALTDTKNDVAFAFSLIPLAMAVVGIIVKRRR